MDKTLITKYGIFIVQIRIAVNEFLIAETVDRVLAIDAIFAVKRCKPFFFRPVKGILNGDLISGIALNDIGDSKRAAQFDIAFCFSFCTHMTSLSYTAFPLT
jgi:hypothetical protein